jgi:hypothetical protein
LVCGSSQWKNQKQKLGHLSSSKVDSRFLAASTPRLRGEKLCAFGKVQKLNYSGGHTRGEFAGTPRCFPELFIWREKSDKMKNAKFGKSTGVPRSSDAWVSAGGVRVTIPGEWPRVSRGGCVRSGAGVRLER